jgi:glycosyltransferase involved in cell wall biosynthesis
VSLSVLALTRYDRKGASSRVRFLQYLPHLARHGVQVTVQPLLTDAYLERLYRDGTRSPAAVAAACLRRLFALIPASHVDIVWLQREVLPFAPLSWEKRLLAGRKLVVDFDDAHHLYYKSRGGAWAQALYGDKIEGLMRHADAVTVGNRTLADVAQAAGARAVHVIPSAVDVSRFAATAPAEPFTVGWIGTPMTAAESLPLLQAPLARFLRETGARCLLVGVRPDQFPNLPAERLPWSEDAEGAQLARIAVGLCPLADTAWNRGKSGYKIIQYMAAARPSLVSPVGIAADLVDDGQTGFHCRTEDDWYRALMRLYRERDMRLAMGARARTLATTRYDTAVAAAEIARIFASVCDVPRDV